MLPDGTTARPLLDGSASAKAAVLDSPLSLWGGFDPASGLIIDVHHPQHGDSISGKIVVMGSGRGSSSASSVLVEAIRQGSAPAAFVLSEPDEILVLGAVVGHELYDVTTPVVVLDASHLAMIRHGHTLVIGSGGSISGG